METRNLELPPPPPGAVNALMSGFNVVANNVVVILFPIAFDIFLWLGPRLKADALLMPMVEFTQQMPTSEQMRSLAQMMGEIASGFNLFAVVRTFPLGIFSLMNINLSLLSPLGQRMQLDPVTATSSVMLVLLLTLAGWMLGSLYYRAVAVAVLKNKAPGIFHSVLHGTLLSLLWMILFLIANLPFVVFIGLLSLFDGFTRIIITILLAIPLSWLVIAIFFSAHGVFVGAQNAFLSAWNSFRMVRYGLPTLGWFAMLALVISQGLDLLWRIAPAESWMTLIGIFGHAFITTSLLAASFIYYRDMNVWIESAMQWLKAKNTSSARA